MRFIGDPQTRIREDYLRILRLFRFHADYGEGPLDRPAFAAAARLRSGLELLSRERIGAEFAKLLMSRRAAETVAEVAEAGFASIILAGVADTRAFRRVVEALPSAGATTRLAALAVFQAEDAVRLRERLRLSNAESAQLERTGRALDALHAIGAARDDRLLRRLAFRHGAVAARDAVAIDAARRGRIRPRRRWRPSPRWRRHPAPRRSAVRTSRRAASRPDRHGGRVCPRGGGLARRRVPARAGGGGAPARRGRSRRWPRARLRRGLPFGSVAR